MTSEELEDVSARVGADWKSVGNGLKLPHPVLDSIDANATWALGDKVEDMLKRWMSYRGDRATVSRLTKALFNHHEFDAIAAVEP